MKKSNKLTLWIFIALLLGILCGWWLNVQYPAEPKKTTAEALAATAETLTQLETATPLKEQVAKTLADSTMEERAKWETVMKLIQAEKKNPSVSSALEKAARIDEPGNKKLKSILDYLAILTDIFLRLIKMIIAPLVFATLVAGVAKLGDIRSVGRIGGKTLLWFICASFVSLLLGCFLVNLFEPGVKMGLELPFAGAETGVDKAALSLRDFITHIIPKSIAEAMATNEILQILIFAIFFGVAAAAVGEKAEPVVRAMDIVGHIMLKITTYIMYVAPFAVFAAMTGVIARKGLSVLGTYAIFIGEFYAGLVLLWGILIFAGFLLVRRRIFTLIRRIREPLLIAFSTSTNEAAYPKLLEELERFGCPNRITSFVLPLGYSFNLDGSMMYMTFASLFIAQSYGMEMTIGTQLTMLLVLMVTSKGIAGVPRASLVVIAGTLATFGIPEAGLVLLLGVDHVLDMGRSATNVVGNAVATVAVSKWEKSLEN
ncbi:MAG: dicarboxylate/amino acid:cation symporter [Flavobacteriales bacterium]|nr:dicarboxylate/amino acid:cation symporter [Flavobacteriales bacterium]